MIDFWLEPDVHFQILFTYGKLGTVKSRWAHAHVVSGHTVAFFGHSVGFIIHTIVLIDVVHSHNGVVTRSHIRECQDHFTVLNGTLLVLDTLTFHKGLFSVQAGEYLTFITGYIFNGDRNLDACFLLRHGNDTYKEET